MKTFLSAASAAKRTFALMRMLTTSIVSEVNVPYTPFASAHLLLPKLPLSFDTRLYHIALSDMCKTSFKLVYFDVFSVPADPECETRKKPDSYKSFRKG